MSEYILKTAIPSESESKGLVYNGALYFPSNTHLYKEEKDKLSIFTTVEGTITNFSINDSNAFITTNERVFMTYKDKVIGSLRRSATAIDSLGKIFAIGVNNSLEVWQVPEKYSFMLFKQKIRMIGHQNVITKIKILDENRILTISKDCTARIFDIKNRTSKILVTTTDFPTGIFTLNSKFGVVTSKNGSITFFNLDENNSEDKHTIDLKGTIVCSSGHEDIFAVVLENIENSQSEEVEDQFHFGVKENEKIKSKHFNTKQIKKYSIVFFKEKEEMYRTEIDSEISEACLFNGILAIKAKDFVGIHEIQNKIFKVSIELPKIINFDMKNGLIAAVCSDNALRIYNNHNCTGKLFDEKSKGDLFSAHLAKNSCVAMTKAGHVSLFNISDSICYRSFFIGEQNSPDLIFDSSAIDEDGRLLFASNKNGIFVVDLQKSKLIETIPIEAPIIKLQYVKEHLYFLDLKNQFIKYDLYSGKSSTITSGLTKNSFAIKNGIIAISTSREISLYDYNLVYLSGLPIFLEGRHREEAFYKNKPVSVFDIDLKAIICGGVANMIKIVDYDQKVCLNAFDPKHLYRNCVRQKIRISQNKEWENYKSKLAVEKKTKFNKKNFIEARKILSEENRFCVLTREGISIYELNKFDFYPVEFDIEASEEFVLKNLAAGNYIKALIASLQINNTGLIKNVLESADDLEFLIRYIPQNLQTIFSDNLTELIKEDISNTKLFGALKWALYFFKDSSFSGLLDLINGEIKNDYKILKETYFMLAGLSL